MSESRLMNNVVTKGLDWLTSRTLADTQSLLQIAHLTVPVVAAIGAKWWSGQRNTDADLHNLQRERESAASLHAEAVKLFQAGQYGAAIAMLDRAINDLYRSKCSELKDIKAFWATGAKEDIIELAGGKLVFAEIHRFKGILLFYQGNYAGALNELQISATIIPENPLTLNVQAFIYLHKIHGARDQAKSLLLQSLKADETQIFARFYLALFNENLEEVNNLIRELEQIAERRKKSEKKDLEAGSEIELRNYSLTSLEIFLPYLLADWLDFYTEQCNDPEILSNIAATCHQLVEELTSTQSRQALARCLTSKVKVLLKISQIKSEGARVSDQDQEWLNSFTQSSKDDAFYLIDAPELIDRNLLRKFSNGFDSAFLKTSDFRRDVANHIFDLALASQLADDHHPGIVELRDLCKELRKIDIKDEQERAALETKIVLKAFDSELITHFVDFYVTDRGPEPWLRLTSSYDTTALFYLLCKSQKIAINAFTMTKDGFQPNNDASVNYEGSNKTVSILRTSNRIVLLQSVKNNMSKFYRLLALTDCLKLWKLDRDNPLAKKILASRGTLLSQQWPYPQLASLTPSNPITLFSVNGQAFLQERQEKHRKKNKAIIQYEVAKIELLAILKTLQEQYLPRTNTNHDESLVQALQRVCTASNTPYAECAAALLLRLRLQRILPNSLSFEERQSSIANLRQFKTFEGKLFADLVLAEVELRGDQNDGQDGLSAPNPSLNVLLPFLRRAGIIQPNATNVTLQEFKRSIQRVSQSTLLSYCLGYAATLLAMTCTDEMAFTAYLKLSMDLGYVRKASHFDELHNQVAGRIINYSNPEISWLAAANFAKDYYTLAFHLTTLHYHRVVRPDPQFCALTAVQRIDRHLLKDWEEFLYAFIAQKELVEVYRVFILIAQKKIKFNPNWQRLNLQKYSPSERCGLLNDLYRLSNPQDLRYRTADELENLTKAHSISRPK